MNMDMISIKDLKEELRERMARSARVIAVDGVSGAGQKELAGALAAQFKCQLIDLGENMDFSELKTAIEAKAAKASVIISGILMRKAMAEVQIQPDISVYVAPAKKNSRRSFWEGILSKPLQEYLSELNSDLDKKTVKYHWKFHPIINADYLVEGS
jgi:ABC-type uncharacterized transport system ATPase subunit